MLRTPGSGVEEASEKGESRRRQERIIHEMAYLLSDFDPQYLSLRDFEIPNSDYDGPDADFDIKNTELEQNESTTLSPDFEIEYEEEGDDEIQSVI